MKDFFIATSTLISITITAIFVILAIIYLFKWARIVLKPPAKTTNTDIKRAEKFKELSLASFAFAALTVITYYLAWVFK